MAEVRKLPLKSEWRTTNATSFREARNARNRRADAVVAVILGTLQDGLTQFRFPMPAFERKHQAADWLKHGDGEDATTAALVMDLLEGTGVNLVDHRSETEEAEAPRPMSFAWVCDKGVTFPAELAEEHIIYSSFSAAK